MVKEKEKLEWIDKVIKRKLLVNQKRVKWKEIKVYREKKEIMIYGENGKFQSELIKYWRKWKIINFRADW